MVERLVYAIEGEMMAEGAALSLCAYSGAAFSTAEVLARVGIEEVAK